MDVKKLIFNYRPSTSSTMV